MTSNTEFTIIEIKNCRDTQPEGQERNASKQHEELCKRLTQKWACKVTLITILLGVGGTIYKAMEESMRSLGVVGSAYTKLAKELNLIAADYAQQAMALRAARYYSARKSKPPIHRGGGQQRPKPRRQSNTPHTHSIPIYCYNSNPTKHHRSWKTSYRNGQPD
jgi:hypothetical protein